jgi:DNA polymerase-3 subunit alpha
MILHKDFETTGIPVGGVPSNDPRHPWPVSLSAVLDDADGNIIGQMSVIIKADGRYKLEDFPEAQKVHGITTEQAESEGVQLEDALDQFAALMEKATIISAFNRHFDEKLFKIGCARYRSKEGAGDVGEMLRQQMEAKQGCCTMEAAAQFLIGKKRISLKNAYFELFKEETQTGQFHGSLSDTMASRRIYWELVKRGAAMGVKSLARKEYDTPYQADSGAWVTSG